MTVQFFQLFYKSLWQPSFYRHLRLNPGVFSYASKLCAVSSLLLILLLFPQKIYEIKSYTSNRNLDHIINQLPSFQLKSSKLHVSEDRSFIVRDMENREIAYVNTSLNEQQALDLLAEKSFYAIFSEHFFILQLPTTQMQNTYHYPKKLNYRYHFLNDREHIRNDFQNFINHQINQNNLAFTMLISLAFTFSALMFKTLFTAFFLSIIVAAVFRFYSRSVFNNENKRSQTFNFTTIMQGSVLATSLPMLLTFLAMGTQALSSFLSHTFSYLSLFSLPIALYFSYVHAYSKTEALTAESKAS